MPDSLNQRGGTLDTQKIVNELKAELNRLDRAIAALDGANTTPTAVGTDEPSGNGTKETPSYVGSDAEAIIYGDETTVGGEKEKGLGRPEVKRPQRSLGLPGAVTYLFSNFVVELKALNCP
jgi:hypothetical protein